MKQKRRQKIMAYLVIAAILFTCIQPITAFATEGSLGENGETTIEPGKAVYTDMGLISGYDSGSNGYDFIWMGNYKEGTDDKDNMGSSLKWRVLDDKTNTGEDGYFLLACGTVDDIYFEKTGDAIGSGTSNPFGDIISGNQSSLDSVTSLYTKYGYSTLYKQSDARMWCQDFAGQTTGTYKWEKIPSGFTGLEQAAILPTIKSDASYTSKYKNDIGITYSEVFMGYNSILDNDKVFLPSAEELYNEDYGIKATINQYPIWTWLRSYPLPYSDTELKAGEIKYDQIFVLNAFEETFSGSLSGEMANWARSAAATPAFNLAPDKALFTMAADNSGQVDFALAKDYADSEWKLTLKDSNSFANGASVSGNTTMKVGDSLTVTHKALSSLSADYTNVTAALIDENGNVYAYGSVNNNTASTSSTITIPAGCADGTYTLMISGEDWNAAYNTNYATGTPFTTTIQVNSKEELSGTVNIAGTLEVGQTLSVSVTGSNGGDTLTYNWYREGSADSIGSGSNYKLTVDDYGKNIICKVTSTQHIGEISKTTGPVGKGIPNIGTVTASELSDTLDAAQVTLSRSDTTVAGTLGLTDTELQYGTREYNWKFTPDSEGYKSITGKVSVTVNDTIAPTARYQVNNSEWREFVNFVTFDIFCKDTAILEVKAADSGIGVDSVKYYVSTSEVAEPSTITAWEDYNGGVALNKESANYIFVQVKDKAGNTAIYEEGVAVYAESTAITTGAVEYTYKQGSDQEILVDLNGNTVKSITLQAQNSLVKSSGTTLTAGTDYSIDAENNKIVLKASYLDTLKASDTAYSFQVKYNPVGIDTDKVDMSTAFSVKVSKATLNAGDGDVTASGIYGAKLSELTVTGTAVTSNGNDVAGQWVLTGDTVPVVGDTGSYEAVFVPNADADNYETLTKTVVLNIAKANAECTAPVVKTGLTYQKEVAQTLIDAGSTEHGTMKYAIGSSSVTSPDNGWDTEIPTGINAGTYYVWYKVVGDTNHKDSQANFVEVNIAKADAAGVTLPAKEHVYTIATSGNEVDLSTEIPSDGGEVAYAVNVIDSSLATYITNVQVDVNGKLTYDTTQAAAPVDGLYIVVTVASENYNDFEVKLPITLSDKKVVTITLPTPQNEEYDHEAHTGYTGTPVVDGYNVAFEIVYEGRETTVYPATTEKPVNVGDYKLTFTVNDDRVQGSAPLEFSIVKGNPVLADVKANVLENTTNLNEITVTYQTDLWSEGQLTIDNGQNLVCGNNRIRYTFTPNDTDNLNAVSGEVNVLVKDTISPKIVLSVAGSEWKTFFNNITFGLLFNKTQQVTIVYEDNENGSGLSKKLYYISDKELTLNELETVTWKSYTNTFSIDPDGKYVIYAKAVDKDGNIAIVNSDGITLEPEPTLTPAPTTKPSAPETPSTPTPAPTVALVVTPVPTVAPTANPEPTGEPVEMPKEADTTIVDTIAKEEVVEAAKETVTVTEGTATVDKTAVEAIVEATTEETTVVIPLTQITEEVVNKAEINTEALASVADAEKDIVIELTVATVKLDAKAVQAITEQADGETIEIRVVKAETSSLTSAQQKKLKEMDTAIVVSAQIFSDGEYIGKFKGGKATVMLPFEIEEGRDAKDYKVYYIDEKGDLKKVAAEYVNGHMVFTTAHFSDYAIVYEGTSLGDEPDVMVTPETPAEESSIPMIPIIVVIGIIMVGGIVLVMKKEKY